MHLLQYVPYSIEGRTLPTGPIHSPSPQRLKPGRSISGIGMKRPRGRVTNRQASISRRESMPVPESAWCLYKGAILSSPAMMTQSGLLVPLRGRRVKITEEINGVLPSRPSLHATKDICY